VLARRRQVFTSRYRVTPRGYGGTRHRSHNSLVQTPGGCRLAGVTYLPNYQEVYGRGVTRIGPVGSCEARGELVGTGTQR
jgi:hypothetical protein